MMNVTNTTLELNSRISASSKDSHEDKVNTIQVPSSTAIDKFTKDMNASPCNAQDNCGTSVQLDTPKATMDSLLATLEQSLTPTSETQLSPTETTTIPLKPTMEEVTPKETDTVVLDTIADKAISPTSKIRPKQTDKDVETVIIDCSQMVNPVLPIIVENNSNTHAILTSQLKEVDAATATAKTQMLVETIEAIAEKILITPGLLKGDGKLLIQLTPTTLEGSQLFVEVKAHVLSVQFYPATQNIEHFLISQQATIEQTLGMRIQGFEVNVGVSSAKSSKRDNLK